MYGGNPYISRVVEDVDPYGDIYIVVPSTDGDAAQIFIKSALTTKKDREISHSLSFLM
jgi:hypothetical protein